MSFWCDICRMKIPEGEEWHGASENNEGDRLEVVLSVSSGVDPEGEGDPFHDAMIELKLRTERDDVHFHENCAIELIGDHFRDHTLLHNLLKVERYTKPDHDCVNCGGPGGPDGHSDGCPVEVIERILGAKDG